MEEEPKPCKHCVKTDELMPFTPTQVTIALICLVVGAAGFWQMIQQIPVLDRLPFPLNIAAALLLLVLFALATVPMSLSGWWFRRNVLGYTVWRFEHRGVVHYHRTLTAVIYHFVYPDHYEFESSPDVIESVEGLIVQLALGGYRKRIACRMGDRPSRMDRWYRVNQLEVVGHNLDEPVVRLHNGFSVDDTALVAPISVVVGWLERNLPINRGINQAIQDRRDCDAHRQLSLQIATRLLDAIDTALAEKAVVKSKAASTLRLNMESTVELLLEGLIKIPRSRDTPQDPELSELCTRRRNQRQACEQAGLLYYDLAHGMILPRKAVHGAARPPRHAKATGAPK